MNCFWLICDEYSFCFWRSCSTFSFRCFKVSVEGTISLHETLLVCTGRHPRRFIIISTSSTSSTGFDSKCFWDMECTGVLLWYFRESTSRSERFIFSWNLRTCFGSSIRQGAFDFSCVVEVSRGRCSTVLDCCRRFRGVPPLRLLKKSARYYCVGARSH